jgi:hypothetical protein
MKYKYGRKFKNLIEFSLIAHCSVQIYGRSLISIIAEKDVSGVRHSRASSTGEKTLTASQLQTSRYVGL